MVDLPTPPLPEATATTDRIPGRPGLAPGSGRAPGDAPRAIGLPAGAAARAPPGARSAVSTAVTEVTPGNASTACSQARRNGSLASASLGSTSRAKPTLLPLTTMPDTISRATTLWPRAASTTPVRALRTCSRLTSVMVEHSAMPHDILASDAESGGAGPGRLRPADIGSAVMRAKAFGAAALRRIER